MGLLNFKNNYNKDKNNIKQNKMACIIGPFFSRSFLSPPKPHILEGWKPLNNISHLILKEKKNSQLFNSIRSSICLLIYESIHLCLFHLY